MTDYAQAWSEAHDRVVVLACGADVAARTVPACPDWTVKDLVAHVAGVGIEHVAGTDAAGHPPEWTAKTVADRADASLEDVISEWAASAPDIEKLVGGGQPGLLIDLAVHEQDLRGALGEPGARDGDAADAVFAFYTGLFAEGAKDLPLLHVDAGVTVFDVGGGAEAGTLTVDPWELARACGGRRSEAQVRAWDWPIAPDPWLGVLSTYGLRDTDLVE